MKNRNVAFILILLLSGILSSGIVQAKENVKIAVIGSIPPHFPGTNNPQEIVDKVIKFWEKEFQKVLLQKPDLIVLPEACDRPRGLSSAEQLEYFRQRKNQVLDFFASVAQSNQCYIAFNSKHEVGDKEFLNSSFMLNRQGETIGVYHKNYPTIGEMELGIKAGDEVPVFECDFGTVACAVCFDLNFDELRQKFVAAKPDVILFSSMYHGGLVQSYWAYSCQSYFVGAMGFVQLPSEIRNPLGQVVASSTNYFNYTVGTVNLDYELVHLDYNWEKLVDLKKKYGDAVIINDPGQVGAVLVTSEHDKVNVQQMLAEFEIETLDEYFDRSRNFREEPGNKH